MTIAFTDVQLEELSSKIGMPLKEVKRRFRVANWMEQKADSGAEYPMVNVKCHWCKVDVAFWMLTQPVTIHDANKAMAYHLTKCEEAPR